MPSSGPCQAVRPARRSAPSLKGGPPEWRVKCENRQSSRRAAARRDGASDDDRPGVGGPSQAFDERELGDRTVAADFDIDPMAGSPDMRVAEAMVRRRVKALVRIDEADARDEDEEAGAKIAAEHQLIRGRSLGAAADLSAADLAEGFIECSGFEVVFARTVRWKTHGGRFGSSLPMAISRRRSPKYDGSGG